MSDIIKVQCQMCSGVTNHEIEYIKQINGKDSDTWWADTYQLIRCLGCDAVSLRHVFEFSETYPDETIKLYPPRTSRKKPSWVEQLYVNSTALAELLDEVYVAVDGAAKRLIAMGIRSVLEHVMLEKVGDQGTFNANLAAFEAGKFISGVQRAVVETVIDVGSATIHRGYLPKDADIEALLGVMESVVKSLYIDEPAMQRIKAQVPPRPSRKATAVAPAAAAASTAALPGAATALPSSGSTTGAAPVADRSGSAAPSTEKS